MGETHMARSSSVSFEAVEQICFQLLSQGENPSFNLVYAELGNKGSSEIVQRYIDQWRRETGAAFFRQRSVPGMPDGLVTATDRFMAEVWQMSLHHAEQLLESRRVELEQEREAIRAQLQLAHDQIGAQNAEAVRVAQQLETLERKAEACEITIGDLRTQNGDLMRQREALETRVRLLEEAAETREQKFTAESERLAKLLQTDRDRYNASLKEEQERGAVEREHLMKQIDVARQEKLAEITSMRQQLATREERETRQREQAEEARAALREAQSRARQMETSLAAAEGRIERLQAQLKTASDAAHGKESAVAAAEARARAMEDVRIAETARAQRAEAALAETLAELGILRKKMAAGGA